MIPRRIPVGSGALLQSPDQSFCRSGFGKKALCRQMTIFATQCCVRRFVGFVKDEVHPRLTCAGCCRFLKVSGGDRTDLELLLTLVEPVTPLESAFQTAHLIS